MTLVLVGDRDLGDHIRLNTFKLADFGSALTMPPAGEETGDDWFGQVANRGTAGSSKFIPIFGSLPLAHYKLPNEMTICLLLSSKFSATGIEPILMSNHIHANRDDSRNKFSYTIPLSPSPRKQASGVQQQQYSNFVPTSP